MKEIEIELQISPPLEISLCPATLEEKISKVEEEKPTPDKSKLSPWLKKS